MEKKEEEEGEGERSAAVFVVGFCLIYCWLCGPGSDLVITFSLWPDRNCVLIMTGVGRDSGRRQHL